MSCISYLIYFFKKNVIEHNPRKQVRTPVSHELILYNTFIKLDNLKLCFSYSDQCNMLYESPLTLFFII